MNPVKKVAPGAQERPTALSLALATVEFNKSVTAIREAAGLIDNMANQADRYKLLIESQEDKIRTLEAEYTAKLREAEVDLAVRIKEKGKAACDEFLKTVESVTISNAELAQLRKDLAVLKDSYQKDVTDAVTETTNRLEKDHAAAIGLANARNDAAAAKLTAENDFLNQQLISAKATIEMLTNQLNAERNAGIERAKAGAIGNINLGGGNNGR